MTYFCGFISLTFYFYVHQVENLAIRMIKWLKDGGYIFFRESCFHQSGDSKRSYNPTHYREPRFYTKVCSWQLPRSSLSQFQRLKEILTSILRSCDFYFMEIEPFRLKNLLQNIFEPNIIVNLGQQRGASDPQTGVMVQHVAGQHPATVPLDLPLYATVDNQQT